VRKQKSKPVSDTSEMQIAKVTFASQADVGHAWTKRLGEETLQCNAFEQITVSILGYKPEGRGFDSR
jgi:hypothetical protein